MEGDHNSRNDVFVRDRQSSTTTRVSQGRGGTEPDQDSERPVISADGRYVVFAAGADNLVEGDANEHTDVFLVDLGTRTTERISEALGGGDADDASYDPWVSGDGRYVAFASSATNLAGGGGTPRPLPAGPHPGHHGEGQRGTSGAPDGDAFPPAVSNQEG